MAGLAALAYFLALYACALHWHGRGYFEVWNIFFDADPNTNLASLAHGWEKGRNAYSHPLLEFFSLPVQGLAAWLAPVLGQVPDALAERLALAVAPLCATASVGVFGSTVQRLGYRPGQAALASVLLAASFSQLVFGVVPESYALSGLWLALLWRLAVGQGLPRRGIDPAWALLALLLAGTTITNACIFALVYGGWLWHHGHSPARALLKAGGTAALALLLCALALFAVLQFGGFDQGSEGGSRWLQSHAALQPYRWLANGINVLCAFVSGVVALGPEMEAGHFSLVRGLDDAPLMLGSLLLLAILAWRCWPVWRQRPDRWLAGPLLAVLAFNGLLHTAFGYQMLLYSQHWQAPLALLLMPWVLQQRPIRVAAVLLLIVGFNLQFFWTVDAALTAAGRG